MNRIYVVEFPACRMATSGHTPSADPCDEDARLARFERWFHEQDKRRADRWFPREFQMFDRDRKALIRYYALPDHVHIEGEFDIIDFEGGLYATAVCKTGDFSDEQNVFGEILDWIAQSESFVLDQRPGHYDLSHVITPLEVEKRLGETRLAIYVPIRWKP